MSASADALTTLNALVEPASLREFVVRQRWFGSKARAVASATISDVAPLGEYCWLAIVAIRYEDGGRDSFLLPIATVPASSQAAPPPAAVIDATADRVVFDGVYDDACCGALLALAAPGTRLSTAAGEVAATDVGAQGAAPVAGERIARTAPDQSNTSVIFGDRLILKAFRRLDRGINPDVELTALLTRRRFPNAPALRGAVEYRQRAEPEPASLLVVQQYVPNRGNGWEVMLTHLDRLLADPAEDVGALLSLAATLGRRTGEMHVALGSSDDPALRPERGSVDALRDDVRAMRAEADRHLDLLARVLGSLDAEVRADAERLLASRAAIGAAFDDVATLDEVWRIRCHGDYHLGQTLVTAADDFVILDFEGEPARPIAERRQKSSPLRDVAGMLRSFSYAAVSAVRARQGGARATGDGGAHAAVRIGEWERQARAHFLDAYREATAAAPFIPRDPRTFNVLLRAFTAQKAAYELAYELNNRPDWVAIPIRGLNEL